MKTVSRYLHGLGLGASTAASMIRTRDDKTPKRQQVENWMRDDRVFTDGKYIYRKIGEFK